MDGNSLCKDDGSSSIWMPLLTTSDDRSTTVTPTSRFGLTQANTDACMPNKNGTTECSMSRYCTGSTGTRTVCQWLIRPSLQRMKHVLQFVDKILRLFADYYSWPACQHAHHRRQYDAWRHRLQSARVHAKVVVHDTVHCPSRGRHMQVRKACVVERHLFMFECSWKEHGFEDERLRVTKVERSVKSLVV